MKLDADTLAAYRSRYLDEDWRHEAFALTAVDVEPGCIHAWLDVLRSATIETGDFHLSAPAALVWISQVGIIYGCWDNALAYKMGEVYLRDIQLSCHQPVTRTEGIVIRVHAPASTRRTLSGDCVLYRGVGIDVDQGAFTGRATFLVPTTDTDAEEGKEPPGAREQLQPMTNAD